MADISTLRVTVRWEVKPWASALLDCLPRHLARLHRIAPTLADRIVVSLAWALSRWGVRYEVGK